MSQPDLSASASTSKSIVESQTDPTTSVDAPVESEPTAVEDHAWAALRDLQGDEADANTTPAQANTVSSANTTIANTATANTASANTAPADDDFAAIPAVGPKGRKTWLPHDRVAKIVERTRTDAVAPLQEQIRGFETERQSFQAVQHLILGGHPNPAIDRHLKTGHHS